MERSNPDNQRSAEVIDLTASDDFEEILLDRVQEAWPTNNPRQHRAARRQPRPHAEVIDLENEDQSDPPPPASLQRQHAIEISEPEVQFIRERPALPPLPPLPPSYPPEAYERSRAPINYFPFPRLDQMRALMPSFLPSGFRGHQQGHIQPARNPNGSEYGIRIGRHTNRHPPTGSSYSNVILDFQTPAFDLGIMREPPPPARTSPVLEPLKPVREGFTRTPEEGDALICPSCHDELCTGDTDEKRQVWVIKACGHVYCGRCARLSQIPARSAKSKGKNPAIPEGIKPPRPKCVVSDCDKPTRGKSNMIQIFL